MLDQVKLVAFTRTVLLSVSRCPRGEPNCTVLGEKGEVLSKLEWACGGWQKEVWLFYSELYLRTKTPTIQLSPPIYLHEGRHLLETDAKVKENGGWSHGEIKLKMSRA